MHVLRARPDFVGLGVLYSNSGLSQAEFFVTLAALCGDGSVEDCYGAERRHAYAYKAASCEALGVK